MNTKQEPVQIDAFTVNAVFGAINAIWRIDVSSLNIKYSITSRIMKF